MPRLPTKTSANTNLAVLINQIIDYLAAITPKNSPTVRTEFTTAGAIYHASAAKGGKSGWHYGDKIELQSGPYPAMPKGRVIHIQATHAIVTTGIRDAANPTGGLVQSCAGDWVAMRDVPAQTTVDGNDVWNLPQWPYPEPTNMDDESNYWRYLGEMNC